MAGARARICQKTNITYMPRRSNFATLLFFPCLALFSACGQKTTGVSEDDIRVSRLEPLPNISNQLIGKERQVKPSEPDYVPEPIAQSLKTQLAKWPKGAELAGALSYCSGELVSTRLGEKSACNDGFSDKPEPACLEQHGYGKKSIGQALTADRHDLNGDGINDYIISDRYYCQNLSANQSNVYFVMLSKSNKDFKLAYADWASIGLQVVDDKVSGKLVLIESAGKSYGTYSTIYQLRDSKYIPKACIFQDQKGYSPCELPKPQS
ncbi:MAG TPA: hypothetical protein VGD52_24380 [Pseudoduganella sp.]